MVSLAGEFGSNIEELDREAGKPDGSFTSPREESESAVFCLENGNVCYLDGQPSILNFSRTHSRRIQAYNFGSETPI